MIRTAGKALAFVGLLIVAVPSGAACTATDCEPLESSAMETIIGAWCDRYIACDASRGTKPDCVAKVTASFPAPDESGCASDCKDDNGCSGRSSCKSGKVDDCATQSRAMACVDQIKGPLYAFPSFCDSCFR